MSIFTKIINGEIPSYKLAENKKFFAFLDINPNAKGHTLVVPKKEENKIFDLTKADYLELLDFSYDVAKALEKSISCERIGMSVIGLEVPHVHIHLVPTNIMEDMQFYKKEGFSDEEFKKIARSIAKAFDENK